MPINTECKKNILKIRCIPECQLNYVDECNPCKPKRDPCKPKRDPCKPKRDPCKPRRDPCKPKYSRCSIIPNPCSIIPNPSLPYCNPCSIIPNPSAPYSNPSAPGTNQSQNINNVTEGITITQASGTVNYEVRANPVTGPFFPFNFQAESVVVINPSDFRNVITGAMDYSQFPQDTCRRVPGTTVCFFDPSVTSMGVYTSKDAGQTWTAKYPSFQPPGLEPFNGYADPIACFGPAPALIGELNTRNGFSTRRFRAYFGALMAGGTTAPIIGTNVGVVRSDDGGTNWSAPSFAFPTVVSPGILIDRPWMWADTSPTSPFYGYVYVTATLIIAFAAEPPQVAISSFRSRDGGLTWDLPVAVTPISNGIPNPANGDAPVLNSAREGQGSSIKTTTDGKVYVFYRGTPANSAARFSAIYGSVSTDGGASFQYFLVTPIRAVPSSIPGGSFRASGSSSPQIGIDENNNIYVAWTEYDSTQSHGYLTLAYALSNNGVQPAIPTFTLRRLIDIPGRTPLFPGVAAMRNKVFVGFIIINDVPAGTPQGPGILSYDSYFVIGNTNLTDVSAPTRISARSSDPDGTFAGPLSCGGFISDYNVANAAPNGNFFYTWTDARDATPCPAADAADDLECLPGAFPDIYTQCPPNFGNSDIYVARISP